MKSNKHTVTKISCRITPLQNFFNPLSRLIVSSLIILIGISFVTFPVINVILYPYSIITWVCALIFIPVSFWHFLRIDHVREIFANENPDTIHIGNGFITTIKDGKACEISPQVIRVSRGVFHTCVLRYDVGYHIAVISSDVINYSKLSSLIKSKSV